MSGEGAGFIPTRGTKRMRRGTISCPVCSCGGVIHGNDPITPMVKALWVHCENTACGMTWRMDLTFVHVISPSGIAHALDLPMAPATMLRAGLPAEPAEPPDPNQLSMFPDHGDPLAPPAPLTPCTGE
ncbi:hypothetical protein SZ64_08035 [Erythrobacter sp. SG61-1L]|uniref:ogr/Delta-like zinc finger family protein n=1 Tax=Erythrobacter sp. SG61-1L TaxID=1603897 RepID=UPI0006C9143F|nr:ogr/Delta-like zinc finger family protein [Erythrobacter sp. SG61-1L]KPL68071.1 hypothetical protein SZ64_08035 [Erythrobacter sp. SG61-1L]